MKGLRALVYAWSQGKHADASFIRMALPTDVQAVICLCEYAGRFGGYSERQKRYRLPVERTMVEQAHARCPKCGNSRVGPADPYSGRKVCLLCHETWVEA